MHRSGGATHRCLAYRDHERVRFATCVGHGGVPEYVPEKLIAPPQGLVWEDREISSTDWQPWITFGFTVVDLDGPRMNVRYVNERVTRRGARLWSDDPAMSVKLIDQSRLMFIQGGAPELAGRAKMHERSFHQADALVVREKQFGSDIYFLVAARDYRRFVRDLQRQPTRLRTPEWLHDRLDFDPKSAVGLWESASHPKSLQSSSRKVMSPVPGSTSSPAESSDRSWLL